MERDKLDEFKVVVPNNVGFIVGDFLRKFVIRGVPTWQIAGFKVDSTTTNFGFSNGLMSTYLKMFEGRIVLEEEVGPGDPTIKKFNWDGKCYRSGPMTIVGLNHGFGDSIKAVLNYTSSVKSANENYEVCKQAYGGEPKGFFVVPGQRTEVKPFRFNVTPIDDRREWLSIKADYDVVKAACDSAVRSLQGLNL